MQVSYRVWFQVKGQELIPRENPCCSSSIPAQAEWAAVSAVNATSWEPLTNLSLVCLGSGSAPRGVVVSSIAGSREHGDRGHQGQAAVGGDEEGQGSHLRFTA